ncbi:TIGR03086 family metal-binding protein [Actinomadura terrae]|uniref:TIGR03086 family metal-binding protein n=1 Tax=Actinomadura terrae TaxID=604353 RepID=UPI001FA7FCF4|nr:TIGR03086 family metal-binding protein [Actinomadura terrae]
MSTDTGKTATPDLVPAARRLGRLIAGAPDSALAAATPCENYTLGDLIDHVNGLSVGLAWTAAKAWPAEKSAPPSGDASNLPEGWRERIPEQLDALAAAWGDPAAWEGMTRAGGVDLPASVAGSVALNELVVHGWDVARALGVPYDVADDEVEQCLNFVGAAVRDSGGAPVEGLFGAAKDAPEGAGPLDRMLAMTGRDPSWTPPA